MITEPVSPRLLEWTKKYLNDKDQIIGNVLIVSEENLKAFHIFWHIEFFVNNPLLAIDKLCGNLDFSRMEFVSLVADAKEYEFGPILAQIYDVDLVLAQPHHGDNCTILFRKKPDEIKSPETSNKIDDEKLPLDLFGSSDEGIVFSHHMIESSVLDIDPSVLNEHEEQTTASIPIER